MSDEYECRYLFFDSTINNNKYPEINSTLNADSSMDTEDMK